MKKQLPMCLMAVCLCIVWTPVSARAYDYRDDILAQDANAEAYYGMEETSWMLCPPREQCALTEPYGCTALTGRIWFRLWREILKL